MVLVQLTTWPLRGASIIFYTLGLPTCLRSESPVLPIYTGNIFIYLYCKLPYMVPQLFNYIRYVSTKYLDVGTYYLYLHASSRTRLYNQISWQAPAVLALAVTALS
ncbi:hypothetical protein DFH27DRAFT_17488 [Peziza echinospora]|nr:hypothetical protein DFH27DRAFT_17488 [Peziza echinospora]